ncbi:MAG: hypothetical protein CME19_18130 [Gemmatimonadetes bacterium]|nr:hypothetical protein [Gemmatimonadota bacterium]|tara:strand:+ start:388 stop:1080 length:693 start_codon:yes stop_codon:yes gene_type:complete
MAEVAVLTEALNEAKGLREVLTRVPGGYDVYLVDDGSTDDTGTVAEACGAKVIRHSVNLGQGLAFATGMRTILGGGYDYAVHLDSDGQHDPADIPRFVKALDETGLDLIAGSRILGGHDRTTVLRGLGLPVLTRVVNRITGYDQTDVMCGFRGYRVEAMRRVIGSFDDYYHPQYNAVEMFIRFSRLGISVGEIPVHVHKRTQGHSYKGEIRYGVNVFVGMMRAFLQRGRS